MDDDRLASEVRARLARGTLPNAMTIVRAIARARPEAVLFSPGANAALLSPGAGSDEPAHSIGEAIERLVEAKRRATLR